ncbi:MAG: hypothetical protein WC655_26010, partial [Candidatus Hydrogenedentales bacterium]
MSVYLLAAVPMMVSLAAGDEHSDIGNLFPFVNSYAEGSPFSLSYLSQPWPDADAWRAQGRAKMLELLGYSPDPVPPAAEVLDTVHKQGYTRLRVRYSVTKDRTTEAFLLTPDGLTGPAPAVVAIHDHGGFYYFGKEKITETEDAPQILKEHIEKAYGGRAFADELARRGFVVLVPDGFYFGSQRLDPSQLPDRFTTTLKDLPKGSDAYIKAFNDMANQHETMVAKTIFDSGTTWPGILLQGDRASVDYLITRSVVDPMRIGRIGLSNGGFR